MRLAHMTWWKQSRSGGDVDDKGQDQSDTTLCWAHGVHERVPPDGAYRICGECGHVYPTPADLADAFNRETRRVANTMGTAALDELAAADAGRVPFCQECLHDF